MQRGSASRIQLVIMSSGCISIIVVGQIFMKSDLVTKSLFNSFIHLRILIPLSVRAVCGSAASQRQVRGHCVGV